MKTAKRALYSVMVVRADGSCFNKMILTLQAVGHEVTAVQYGLDTHAADAARVKHALAGVTSPASNRIRRDNPVYISWANRCLGLGA